MKSIKNIFLDRDGVINEVIFRDNMAVSPRFYSEFKIRKEFFPFYEEAKKLNLNLFVVSNQPDIARRLMNKKELDLMTGELKSKFNFNEIDYCTHDDSDSCLCRKPKPGLILNILRKYDLKCEESIIIGDSGKDIEAGINSGIKTFLLQGTYNQNIPVIPDYKFNSILNFFNI